jgi:hypothetical protein
MKFTGSCHCKAVKFEIDCANDVEVEDCNCSICSKTGFLHLILPLTRFTLIQGHDALTTYTFNSGVAKHTFCKICGVKPFYVPRSNPDGIDVNINCLDSRPKSIRIVKFDGQNWEQNAESLKHKSVEKAPK